MVRISRRSIVEWTYEGDLKCSMQSRCQREPVRYQWGTYDSMLNEWMQMHQFGWYRRSRIYKLLSLSWDRSFFCCGDEENARIYTVHLTTADHRDYGSVS